MTSFQHLPWCAADGKMKDLTAKYDSKWLLTTPKLRVEPEWWDKMIASHHVKQSEMSLKEDEEIKSKLFVWR